MFWMFNCTYPSSVMATGWLFLVFLGILPAAMLRQGVTEGRPARVLDNQLGGVLVLVLSDNQSRMPFWDAPRFRV